MFSSGRKILLVGCLIVISCDNNIRISQQASRYIASVHLSNINEKDVLPEDVKNLLKHEPSSEKKLKFPLAYFLIQEEDTKFLYTTGFDEKISSQLYMTVSGTKYYKLFVHPDSDSSYSFLKHAYRYIGPDETEFLASPLTAATRTMVVWNKRVASKRAFIVKTELDKRTSSMNGTNLRMPAEMGPDSISIIFHRDIKGTKKRIEGQQITKIPAF